MRRLSKIDEGRAVRWKRKFCTGAYIWRSVGLGQWEGKLSTIRTALVSEEQVDWVSVRKGQESEGCDWLACRKNNANQAW